MNRNQKERIVENLVEKINNTKAVYFLDYKGLDVAQSNIVRRRVCEASAEFKVVKNRLAKIAFKFFPYKFDDSVLKNTTALVFGYDDPVKPISVIVELSKEFKFLRIKGGLIGGKVLGPEEVKEISKLPPKEVLRAQFASQIASPLRTFSYLLGNRLTMFLNLLNQLKNKKMEENK
ncbi:MAG: 50S ribosomal protein L10 [Candidatus Aminicenantia bacterium]